MEYLLFPKRTYFLTQGFGKGSYSHQYQKALDVSAAGGGRKEIYAPFSGTVKKKYATTPNIAYSLWLVSDEKVMCADGKMRYAVIMMTHPNEIKNIPVGKKYKQGDYMFNDGTTGGVAAHLDFEIAVYDNKKDIKVDWYQVPNGAYTLYNSVDPTKYMVMKDDTVVLNTYYAPLNKSYHFKTVSQVKPGTNYFVSGGTYKLLYEKCLRRSPNMGNNIVKANEVDNYTKTLLVSKTGNAKFKVGTIITSLKVVKDTEGRIWGSYGNVWYCMQNKDGKKNASKI